VEQGVKNATSSLKKEVSGATKNLDLQVHTIVTTMDQKVSEATEWLDQSVSKNTAIVAQGVNDTIVTLKGEVSDAMRIMNLKVRELMGNVDRKVSDVTKAVDRRVSELRWDQNRTDARLLVLEAEHYAAGSFQVSMAPPKRGLFFQPFKHVNETHCRSIIFPEPFPSVPEVTLAISSFYSTLTQQRFHLQVTDVTIHGFRVKLTLWDFYVSMQVEWIAVRVYNQTRKDEPFQEDDWFIDD
jgi:H-type lectin domain